MLHQTDGHDTSMDLKFTIKALQRYQSHHFPPFWTGDLHAHLWTIPMGLPADFKILGPPKAQNI